MSVDENGEVVTTLKQVANDDVADLSIHGTEKLIEGSITAKTLNVQEIFGDNATIRSLIAANIDVTRCLHERQRSMPSMRWTSQATPTSS